MHASLTSCNRPEAVAPYTKTRTYWTGKGRHEQYVPALESEIPQSGPVIYSNRRALERFRRASNAYYDLYNNGGINRATEIRTLFGVGVKAIIPAHGVYGQCIFNEAACAKVEAAMDAIVLAAAREAGLVEREAVAPNPFADMEPCAHCPFCGHALLVEPLSGDSICTYDDCPGPVYIDFDERPEHCRVTIVEPRFYGNLEVARSKRVRVGGGR